MPMTLAQRAPCLQRPLRLLLALMLLAAGGNALPAQAQSCWTTTATTLDFGTIAANGNTDAQTSVTLTCQGNAAIPTPLRVTACLFVGEGNPPGIAPRRMSNNNGAFMDYDLYADPARTQLIGPVGSTYPIYAYSFEIPIWQTSQVSLPIYGRVPAGQRLAATFPFQGLPAGSVIRYSYHPVFTPSASECASGSSALFGGAGETSFGWTGVYARFPNTCVIGTATDLDFGAASNLATSREQNASIQLRCPSGTAWLVTLNDGANALGATRRMAADTRRISYELYRDAGLQSRWGGTQGTGVSGTGNNTLQSLTVYGQVPAQPGALPGSYRDTITVTLTY